MFSCMRLGAASDDTFLQLDLSQRCYTNNHIFWILIVAMPLIVFFVIGFPLSAWTLLYTNREIVKGNDAKALAFKEKFGFLYNGYDIDFWYWEFVVIFRKVCLVTISVYFSGDTHLQALLAILLCTVALMVQSAARPFESEMMDWMEFTSLLSSFGTFFCGQFLFVTNLPSNAYIAASVLVLLFNLGFCIAILSAGGILLYRKYKRMKKRKLRALAKLRGEELPDDDDELAKKKNKKEDIVGKLTTWDQAQAKDSRRKKRRKKLRKEYMQRRRKRRIRDLNLLKQQECHIM